MRGIREIRGIREGRVRRRGGNTFDNMQQNGVLHLPAGERGRRGERGEGRGERGGGEEGGGER